MRAIRLASLFAVCLAASALLGQNAATPTGPFTLPVTSYAGRYLDSSSTPDFQCCPRTFRARTIRVVPERDAIYMIVGSTFVRQTLSTFVNRVKTEPMLTLSGAGVHRFGTAEKYLAFDDWVDADRSPGWSTVLVDGQDRLMDFDVDDRGLTYLAYGFYGFGIVDSNLDLVHQMTAETIGFGEIVRAFSFRIGDSYYVAVSDGQNAKIYDVTDAASPIFAASMTGFSDWSKSNDGHVAIETVAGNVEVRTTAGLLTGNAAVYSYTPQSPTDITTDGSRFYVLESYVSGGSIHTLTPSASTYTKTTIAAPVRYNKTIDYGAGYLVVGSDQINARRAAIYAVTLDVPALQGELALDYFTSNGMRAWSFVPMTSNGETVLLAAMNSLGEVFGLARPPLAIAQQFSPATILRNETSDLTITIMNPHDVALASFDLSHTLPSDVVNTSSAASTTCGGSLTANAGEHAFTLTNGTIGASSTCTITLHVTSNVTGSFSSDIAAGAIDSEDNTNDAGSSATLTVNELLAPGVAKAFSSASAPLGAGVRLTITLTNPNANAITNTAFVDNYPPSLLNATTANAVSTCGGTLVADGASLTLSGATIPASGSCTASATVRGTAEGVLTNTLAAGAITSGNSAASVDAASAQITIVGVPASFTATAISTSEVSLIWPAVGGATEYELYRSALHSQFALITTVADTSYSDASLVPNRTYVYQMRPVTNGTPGSFSNVDAATTTIFTDSTLTGVSAKALHILELRTAVNAMRAAAGFTATAFADASPSIIKAAHITELRAALDAARSALLLPSLGYTDPSIVAGTTLVKAAHLEELRAGTQ
ncbi:MAG TPA: fibronectin type III domain-containing protein [Thermoanaerobaculia bacterium]|nr:fibronectin type III domain-containing protein [Thermoanaerobaculia bacterium]